MQQPTAILLVCLGNICRSPSAESVLRAKCEKAGLNIVLDSAGTAGYHIGENPDPRAIKVGKSIGYELSNLRARQVACDDFYQFDLIFAMDNNNLANLQKIAPKDSTAKIALFDPSGQAVADPYYGDESDFVAMFEHIEQVVNQYLKCWS